MGSRQNLSCFLQHLHKTTKCNHQCAPGWNNSQFADGMDLKMHDFGSPTAASQATPSAEKPPPCNRPNKRRRPLNESERTTCTVRLGMKTVWAKCSQKPCRRVPPHPPLPSSLRIFQRTVSKLHRVGLSILELQMEARHCMHRRCMRWRSLSPQSVSALMD